MKNLPYMRWFPADAESDEKYASMNDEELGFYHRCLNKSWINNGLPSDLRELASLMKVTPRYLGKVWERVGKCWSQDGGRLFNRRQEEERSHAQSKSDSASAAVRTRYERSNGRTHDRTYERSTNDLPRALARESESESDSDTESKTDTKTHTKRRALTAGGPAGIFKSWIDPWPRVSDFDSAARAWLSVVVTPDDEAAAFSARDRYLASDEVSRNVIAAPEKWLFEQSRSGWAGKWPARQEPERRLSVTERAMQKLKQEARDATR